MMCMSSGSLGGASRVRKRARLFWVGQNSDHKRIHDDTFQIRSVKVLTWDFGYKVSHPLSSVKMYPVVDPEMVWVWKITVFGTAIFVHGSRFCSGNSSGVQCTKPKLGAKLGLQRHNQSIVPCSPGPVDALSSWNQSESPIESKIRSIDHFYRSPANSRAAVL